MKIYNNITEIIGKTPIVKLEKIEKEFELKTKLFAKLEYLNPTGSVKDRAAYYMIKDAKSKGLVKENTVFVEPTSGNTGIGLAAIATALGYKVILTMPETMSVERRKLLKIYGADIVLTDGSKGMKGAIEKAHEIAEGLENSLILSQFTNMSNPQAHFETTGVEIYDDLDGNVDVFVAGIGTGGTISGVGKYLKSKNPNVKVVAVEPSGSPVLSKGVSGPHKIQGIGAGFVPNTLDTNIYDEIVDVDNEDAIALAKEIAAKQGILVGISSGAALYAAVKISQKEEYFGKNIVVLLPDSGDRYLSTALFD